MKKAEGVLEKVTSYENMLEAVRQASKGKRYHKEAMAFREELCANILSLVKEMREGTYQSGRYRERLVYIPQTRLIQVSVFRDRVAQQAIYLVLKHILEPRYILDSYACQKGKGTHNATARLQYWLRHIHRKPDSDRWVCGKVDVAKFFYRLDHDVIMETLAQYIDDPPFMRVMENIIRCRHTPFGLPEGKGCKDVGPEGRLFGVGVPIGSLMSQTMANMVMNEVDQHAKHALKIRHYIRYMDDIIILAPDLETGHRWMAEIRRFLAERLKLQCNRKTQIIPLSHGIPFVGRKIWATHITLRKSTRQHMKKALKHQVKRYAAGAIDQDEAMQCVVSYLGLCKHVDAQYLREWIEENIVLRREDSTSDG